MLQDTLRMLETQVAEMKTMMDGLTTAMGDGSSAMASDNVWEALPEDIAAGVKDTASGDAGQGNDGGAPIPIAMPTAERYPAIKQPEALNLVTPIDGYTTMEFDTDEKNHYGIDLVADENSMIRSVADGVVIFSEYSRTTGYVIGIWHGQNNLVSFYKHNSRLFKPVGSYVFAGEAIAVIGNTGINSSGTHLHFELWYDNNPVNPKDFILFN